MSKRGLIIIGAALLAIFGALVFLVREARDDGADEGPKANRPANGSRARSTTATSPSDEKPEQPARRRGPGKNPRAKGELVKTVKTGEDGRTYVEMIRPDGSKIRDYRKTAAEDMNRERRVKGPRLIARKNGIAVQRSVRADVWACAHEHYDEIRAFPGAGKYPVVIVWAGTKAADDIEITRVEVEFEAKGHHDAVASCIETALIGREIPLTPGIEQKPYEDFEVPLKFKIPPPKR